MTSSPSQNFFRRPHRGGFTLIEMIIIVTIIGILATIAAPKIIQMMNKYNVLSYTQTAAACVSKARLQAIHKGRQVFVLLFISENRIRAFIDEDGDRLDDPDDALEEKVLCQSGLPGLLEFGAPPVGPTDGLIIDNFEITMGSIADPIEAQIVFNGDGSVERAGAFRFRDERENYLELRIGPTRAVSRIATRKWDDSHSAWFGKDEGHREYQGWIWN
jgi:prepilin-type N-terminal cleavage/methylation domain-containing protein